MPNSRWIVTGRTGRIVGVAHGILDAFLFAVALVGRGILRVCSLERMFRYQWSCRFGVAVAVFVSLKEGWVARYHAVVDCERRKGMQQQEKVCCACLHSSDCLRLVVDVLDGVKN